MHDVDNATRVRVSSQSQSRNVDEFHSTSTSSCVIVLKCNFSSTVVQYLGTAADARSVSLGKS